MKFISRIVLVSLALSSLVFAREKVDISFQKLPIKDFIKLTAEITHKNILLNYRINGTVDLITSTPVYDDEVMGILISVLESKGYTLIEKGSVYEVVRSSEAAKHNVKVYNPKQSPNGNLMVTQAIKIKNENVDIVAAKIRYLISKTAKLMTMKESNTLLVTDYPDNLKTIKKVIADIAEANAKIVKTVTIQHADMKRLTSQLVKISKSVFNQKIVNEKVQIIPNEGINAIVLVGLKKNVAKLEALIKTFDKEQKINQRVQVVNLKNSDAKEVLTTLNEIISKKKWADLTQKPDISMNVSINSIIIMGEPKIIEGLKIILKELDREKYQVYVKARIVEVSKTDAENLGIKYGIAGGAASSSGLYSFAANLGGATTQASQTVIAGLGSGVSQMLSVNAALDFLETNGASRTISNPSILCVNNKVSTIYVGKTLSVSTGSISSAINTTNVTNSFKREDIGLTLKVKPRVSSKDKVTLESEVKLENITQFDANGQPVTTKETVKTQTILRHGESIIIGGLVKRFDKINKSKIPLLGDIPLLGYLFKSNENETQEDNLIVVLTPYIITKSEKLSKIQHALGELGTLQKAYDDKIFKSLEDKIKDKDESKQ